MSTVSSNYGAYNNPNQQQNNNRYAPRPNQMNNIRPQQTFNTASGSSPSASQTSSNVAPPVGSPQEIENSRNIAQRHYIELSKYLNGKDLSTARSSAREKLTRLTRQQFLELSVDVYDELIRRKQADLINANEVPSEPFLLSQPGFHPKRNQARQKLATLATSRYKDLASDVYFELERRYPEFKEYNPLQSHIAAYAQSGQDTSNSGSQTDRSGAPSPAPSNSQMSLLQRQQQQQQHAKSPSLSATPSSLNNVSIPSTSNLLEEDLSVTSSSLLRDQRSPPIAKNPYDRPLSPPSNMNNSANNSLNTSNNSMDDFRDRNNFSPRSESSRNNEPLSASSNRFNSRVSEASSIATKFIGGYASHTNERGNEEEVERLKSDYELKIAQLQQKVSTLEREKEDLEQDRSKSLDRAREVEQDLKGQLQRNDDQSRQIRNLQGDLSDLQHANSKYQSQSRSAVANTDEQSRLRHELELSRRNFDETSQVVDELRNEVKSLLEELSSLNSKFEATDAERSREQASHRDQIAALEAMKVKYEKAKTELRNLKATSQLFVQAPAQEDSMPASENGAIADVHVTAFQSSIDALLQSGRSQTPSSVLKATNAIVQTVTSLDQDVQAFEARSNSSLSEEDVEHLQALKIRCNATLSNLITAAKNHAAGHGLSPVSLLDAAASHLSATVIDLVKLLKVRRGTFADMQRNNSVQQSSQSPSPARNDREASAQPVAMRKQPSSSTRPLFAQETSTSVSPSYQSRSNLSSTEMRPQQPEEGYFDRSYQDGKQPSPLVRSTYASQWRPNPNGNNEYQQDTRSPPARARQASSSSQDRNSSPVNRVFDSPVRDLDNEDGSLDQGLANEVDWAEFRAYLETQTEAIVHSIQSLLAAIRNGTQGAQLDEHLTEIITIVSSIAAISRENLPPEFHQQSDSILVELESNCDKLSDLQGTTGQGSFSKQTKQAVASASFAIARSLKQLNLLLADDEANDLR